MLLSFTSQNSKLCLWRTHAYFALNSRYIHARIARQKRRDYLNFASVQRYAYKQSTRKLSRSWLPTGRNTLVRMSVHPGWANPHPSLISSSYLHLSIVPLPRRGFFPGSRGSWARNTINSLRESPRVTASKNIYFPNAPIGSIPAPTSVSLYRTHPSPDPPRPSRPSSLSRKGSYLFAFHSSVQQELVYSRA